MLPSTLLVEFVVTKSIIIAHEFDIKDFLLKEDIIDMLSWSESECVQIWNRLQLFDSHSSCPWCVKYQLACTNCGYGERHKICGELNSKFMELRKRISDKYGPISIMKIPQMYRNLKEVLDIPYNINYKEFCKVYHIKEKK